MTRDQKLPPSSSSLQAHCSYSVAIVAPPSQQELLFGSSVAFVLKYETNLSVSIRASGMHRCAHDDIAAATSLDLSAVCHNPKKISHFPNHKQLPHIDSTDLWLPFLATSPFFFFSFFLTRKAKWPHDFRVSFSIFNELVTLLFSLQQEPNQQIPLFFVEQLDAQPGCSPLLSVLFCFHAAAVPQPERFAPHPPTIPGCRLIDLSPPTPATQRGHRASDSGSCRKPQGRGGCRAAAWKYCRHRCVCTKGFLMRLDLHYTLQVTHFRFFVFFLLKWHN